MPTTSRGNAVRCGFSMPIFAIASFTILTVDVSLEGSGLRIISSHPAGTMRAFTRLPGSSDRGEGGRMGVMEGGTYAGSLVGVL